MNHIIPIRNETSTWSLYLPAMDSEMTLPNQANSTARVATKPMKNTGWPQAWPFIQFATPIMVMNRVMDPAKGHGLWCGT